MKIAVVGAGALGSVYGVRLSKVAEVSFVVRSLERAPRALRIEHVTAREVQQLESPAVGTAVPADAEAVLVAVRVDQLDEALWSKLAAETSPEAIVVVLAPLLPHRYAHARELLGDRLVPSMPGVVAYGVGPGRVRYWTPRPAPTQLEERPEGDPKRARVHALVAALREAGIPAETAANVRGVNAAVTIAFFPMLTGIAAGGGSIDRMLADDRVMKLGFAAAKETKAIAQSLGSLPAWGSLFFSFAGPLTARAGIKLGRSKAPEVFTFLEQHFGQKLIEQNLAIFHDIERIATERGIRIDNLRRLMELAHG